MCRLKASEMKLQFTGRNISLRNPDLNKVCEGLDLNIPDLFGFWTNVGADLTVNSVALGRPDGHNVCTL